MNKVYRLVWSASNQLWMAASELTRGRCKSTSRSLLALALMGTARIACADCTAVTGTETAGCTLGANQSLTIQPAGTLNGWINMAGAGAALTVQNAGTFQYGAAVPGAGASAILLSAANQTVTNNGTLRVSVASQGVDVISPNGNGFMIVNGATGLIASNNLNPVANAMHGFVANVSGRLINQGTISATGGASEGTIFMNANGGVFTLDNRLGGTIRGERSVAVNVNSNRQTLLRNAGTIATGVVNGTAIALGSANDSVTLESTSSITGIVTAGTGTDTLALAGAALDGVFDIAQIGSSAQYRAFEVFQKIEAGTWTLNGTATTATSWTATGGILRLGSSSLGLSSLTAAGGDVAYANGVLINSPMVLNTATRLLVEGTDRATQAGVVSGSGAATKSGGGTLVLSGANSYTGGTTIEAGTLQLGNGGVTGAILGNVADNGTLAFNRSDAVNFPGVISGVGSVAQLGSGTTTLINNHSYTGGTTITAGRLQLGNGGTTGSIVGDVNNNSALAFNRGDTLGFGGLISGTGSVSQIGAGATILSGNNSYQGPTTVAAGSLYIDGNQAGATGLTSVAAGATLGGTGTLGGGVTVANAATLSPGAAGTAPGTLAVNGSLSLASGSLLAYGFGRANAAGGQFNDLTNVGGDLTLDGTLNVTVAPGGSFEPGVYRVFNYGGALNDQGLVLGAGTLPGQFVQTSVAGQVNLVNAAGLTLRYWDGALGPKNNATVNGRNGLWQNASGNDNWTNGDGLVNAPFSNGSFAVFMAQAGLVAVDNSLGQVSVSGMQFAADGYRINGGSIALVGAPSSTVRVGDGSSAGAGYTATIDSMLTGISQLVKSDLGTLVLTGANTYSGGTAIQGGVLEIASDTNLGAASGPLSFDGGTLRTTATIATSRATTVSAAGGAIDTAAGTTLTHTGSVGGSGALVKAGAGTLVLSADATYSGGTTISGGTLQLGNGGVTGSLTGDVVNHGSLVFDRSTALSFDGKISGSGTVVKLAGSNLTLAGASSYSGGTALKAGQITIAHGNALGSGTLAMDEGTTLGFAVDGLNVANAVVLTGTSDPVIDTGAFSETLSGVISGGGALTKNGSGTLVLSGANTYSGATTVASGTLRAGTTQTFSAASAHTVAAGATLDTAGFNQRVASLTNSGTVNLVSGAAGSTLTVTGAYVGNGGLLRLGTALAGSGSASDRLVLDGPTAAASGSTNVQIVNLGGLGALTTGNGIEVISATGGATTTAQTTRSAFSLAGGHVDAGAFEYRLHAADALGAGENWYLRSTTAAVPPVIPPPVGEVLPPGAQPTPPSLPPLQIPTYRAEVPLVAALPAQFRQSDLAMLGNLHRRVGDEDPAAITSAGTAGASGAAAAGTRRAWGRLVYADLDIEQAGIAQPHSDGHVSGLQVGTDLFVTNAWKSGIYVGYLDGSADVTGNARGLTARVGSNDLRSRFLGAYATWMDASGWYVDSVLQGASQRYDVKPDINPRVSGKASSFTASIESGKPFALNERWSIEPQAQLAWQHSSFDDLFLGGARVQQDADSGWIGRLGVRIKGDLATSAGRLQPYGRLNLYHASFGDDAATFIGPAGATVIASAGGYSAAEVAAGATLALTLATSLYGEIGHLWDIGGDTSVKSSVQASLGVKVRW